jgi:hypothetical protein
MIKTSCERRSFPASMRWLHAGGDLPRPNSIPQRTDRALTRFERPPESPKCLLHSADLPYVQTTRVKSCQRHAIIEVGASIKSP